MEEKLEIFYIRHAENVTFKNVKVFADKKDYRPAIVMDDVNGGVFTDVKATSPKLKATYFQAKNCKNIKK